MPEGPAKRALFQSQKSEQRREGDHCGLRRLRELSDQLVVVGGSRTETVFGEEYRLVWQRVSAKGRPEHSEPILNDLHHRAAHTDISP